MRKISSLVVLLSLVLPSQAFWFRPILETSYDVSDNDAVLAMIAGKKYRIKFYNIDCPDCKTILNPDPDIGKFVNIRTEIKTVGKHSLTTHHVIEVQHTTEPVTGQLYLEDINRTYVKTINFDINTKEACDLKDKN